MVSRWELDKFKNCWNKSFRSSKILTLLYQQFSNMLISQRDMSGLRFRALSLGDWVVPRVNFGLFLFLCACYYWNASYIKETYNFTFKKNFSFDKIDSVSFLYIIHWYFKRTKKKKSPKVPWCWFCKKFYGTNRLYHIRRNIGLGDGGNSGVLREQSYWQDVFTSWTLKACPPHHVAHQTFIPHATFVFIKSLCRDTKRYY